jgi:hypothetical protein
MFQPNSKVIRHKLSLKSGRKYIRKYWKKGNPKYLSFPDDCTNYASQIMYAEGFRMTPTDYKHLGTFNLRSNKTKDWYMRKDWYGTHYSTSWSTVNGFWKHWTKESKMPHFTTTSRKKIKKYAKPGDVVQFWSKKQGWFHTVTVYRKNKKDVYYTSHTANFRGKALRHCNVGRSGKKKIQKFRILRTGVS